MDVSIVSPALQDEILAAQKRITELEEALRTTARDAEIAKRMINGKVPRSFGATALITARIDADCERAKALLGIESK